MKPGKLSSQVAHGSSHIVMNMCLHEENGLADLNDWIENHHYRKVVLKVLDEEQLIKYHSACELMGLRNFLIIDNGYTVFHGEKTITGLAVGPHDDETLDRLFSELSLY